jgi:hypothetical protein
MVDPGAFGRAPSRERGRLDSLPRLRPRGSAITGAAIGDGRSVNVATQSERLPLSCHYPATILRPSDACPTPALTARPQVSAPSDHSFGKNDGHDPAAVKERQRDQIEQIQKEARIRDRLK